MIKSSIISFLIIVFFHFPSYATTLNDILIKEFKREHYPYEDVVATLNLQTNLTYIKSNSQQHDFYRTLQTHEKMVHTYLKHGWQINTNLELDTINAGLIELALGEGMTLKGKMTYRLKAFIHICNKPKWKYRGGNIDEYFNKIVSRTEKCLVQEEDLQGRNYPY